MHLFGFKHSNDIRKRIEKSLKDKKQGEIRSFLLSNNSLFISKIIDAIELNDSITINLLQSYGTASPKSKADIILTIEKLSNQNEKMKQYPKENTEKEVQKK